jgi:two-component system, NtrC family, response regulator AtoC
MKFRPERELGRRIARAWPPYNRHAMTMGRLRDEGMSSLSERRTESIVNAHVLIADGDAGVRQAAHEALASAGFDVTPAASGAEAWAHFQEDGSEVLLLGLALPDMDGLDLMRRIREAAPSTKVVVMAPRGALERTAAAIELGAHTFIEHPFERAAVVAAVQAAARVRVLEQRVAYLMAQDRKHTDIGSFVHAAPRMAELMRHVEALARSTVPAVLVTGEDGTGKPAVGRLLHDASPRGAAAFVELDCGAVSEEQIEGELFGHEIGAGGREPKVGLIEIADGGTLLLGEVAELPLAVQAKLMAFLQRRSFQRVGARVARRADVRVVAATKRDLHAMVKDGTFRADLLHRLEPITLALPPLRERPEDIQALSAHFMALSARAHGRRFSSITPDAYALLKSYRWPGNVRELRMVINRAVLRYDDDVLRVQHLSHTLPDPSLAGAIVVRTPRASEAKTAIPTLADVELAHIRRVVDLCGGNRTLAAQYLGISRQTLTKRIGAVDEG